MQVMKNIWIITVLALIALADTYKGVEVFNTPLPSKDAVKIGKCWVICEKKVSKVQKMKRALDYYKTSSYYKFSSSLMKRSK